MKKPVNGLIVHLGEVVEGTPRANDTVTLRVNWERRRDIMRNHTGTHLLHAALRNHLGTHVQQRGSLVAPDRLRFDFSHNERITADQLTAIEREINNMIIHSYPVISQTKSLQQAKSEGAMALFGEKYGETVRTIVIADNDQQYSYELCGGTHVQDTAEIGTFVFVSEGSVSAGVRRVEALTGHEAIAHVQDRLEYLGTIASQLGTSPEFALARINSLQDELTSTRKKVEDLQRKLAKYSFDALLNQIESIGGKQALISQVESVPVETLREMADWFRNAVHADGVLVLGTTVEDKPMVLVAVTDDLVKQGIKAGDLIKPIAAIIGGGGGGRPTMAQAGGKDSAKLPAALQHARTLLTKS
jgi:alanyl-tRNA synthetase